MDVPTGNYSIIDNVDGVVNPIVRIEILTDRQEIGVELYISDQEPERYLHSVNGEVSISNVEVDRQNVIDYFGYITSKYNAPAGWDFLNNDITWADTVELSGTI